MKIVGISGRKQAGKNTVANYMNGYVLKNLEMIQDFYIDDNGKLAIKTSTMSGQTGYGIFDPTRKDSSFIEYAEKALWPYIKVYHFADPLKEMSIDLFGLKAEEVYGDDKQKNKKTDLLWQDMPDNTSNKEGKVTNREFLEHFGTKVVRKIKNNAWCNYTIKRIIREDSEIAIIPDVRFPNEIEAIKSAGGVVIRLTRDLYHSDAEPECALDYERYDWKNFDLVINNDNLSIELLCETLNTHKYIWS